MPRRTSLRTFAALAVAAALACLSRTALAQSPVNGTTAPNDTIDRTSVAATAEYVTFIGGTQAWKLGAVSLGQRTAFGSIIGRVNYANRFGSNGLQYEADAYPHLSDGVYAYLNLGYSSVGIFPRWRSGAEIFTNLPDAFEASLGYRQLRFDGATPVTLFTGAVGKYSGNYWYSLRPYIRATGNGASASASLTMRRYYESADHYVGARIGFGTTPTDRLVQNELTRTSSASADVHGSNPLGRAIFGTWSIGYERDQLPLHTSQSRWDLNAGLLVDF